MFIFFLLLILTGDNQEESAKHNYNLQMTLNPDMHANKVS